MGIVVWMIKEGLRQECAAMPRTGEEQQGELPEETTSSNKE